VFRKAATKDTTDSWACLFKLTVSPLLLIALITLQHNYKSTES